MGLDIILKITKFLFLFICVDKRIAIYIIHYVIIDFINNDSNVESYNLKMHLHESDKPNKQKLLENFISKKSNKEFFKIIDFLRNFESDYGTFPTCGETTLLNMFNYCLMYENSDSFKLDKIHNEKTQHFFTEYNSIKKQKEDIRKTMLHWLSLVSSIDDDSLYLFKDGKKRGDVVPSQLNMVKIASILIGRSFTTIKQIIIYLYNTDRINDGTNIKTIGSRIKERLLLSKKRSVNIVKEKKTLRSVGNRLRSRLTKKNIKEILTKNASGGSRRSGSRRSKSRTRTSGSKSEYLKIIEKVSNEDAATLVINKNLTISISSNHADCVYKLYFKDVLLENKDEWLISKYSLDLYDIPDTYEDSEIFLSEQLEHLVNMELNNCFDCFVFRYRFFDIINHCETFLNQEFNKVFTVQLPKMLFKLDLSNAINNKCFIDLLTNITTPVKHNNKVIEMRIINPFNILSLKNNARKNNNRDTYNIIEKLMNDIYNLNKFDTETMTNPESIWT